MTSKSAIIDSGIFKKEKRTTIIFWKLIFPIFCFLLFTSSRISAQVVVVGEVKAPDNSAVPFANVLLLQPTDSTLEAGTITGDDGKFSLKIKPGSYNILVSMLGFNPYYSSIEVSPLQKQVFLPPIFLSENTHQLGEVVVNGKRPVFEKEADRTIINVQNSVSSAGNTVLEVLEKSPGVTVNRQSGSIVLNGKSGVLVMVNNKMNRLPLNAVVQMLDGMSAANVGKIELITNPPAKYDAEGNAGIIHIVMKDNPDMGTNGSFGLTLGYNKAETLAGNMNVNRRSKEFNSFLNYSVYHDHNRHLSYMQRYLTDNGFIQTDIDSSIRNPFIRIQNLNAGLEFILSEKSLVHFSFTGYQRNWDSKNFTTNLFNPSNDTLIISERTERGINIWKNGSAGTGFRHRFNDDHDINLMFDYLYYHNNNPNEYETERHGLDSPATEWELIKTQKKTPIEFIIVNMDYTGKMSEQLSVEAGLNGSWSEFANDVSVTRITENETVVDPVFTNNSSLDEKIFAVYGMLSWKPEGSWNISGGLRYEFTDTYLGSPGESASVDKTYGNFFPNLNITYNLNDKNKLHLAYRKRITRPNYNQMAPYVAFFGLNTFVAGNLSLMPAINDGAEISYQRKNWWVTFHFGNTNNAISEYQSEFDTTANALVYRSQNLDYNRSFGMNTNFSFQLTSWWKLQNYFSFSRNSLKTKHLENNLQNKLNSFSMNTGNTFQITESLTADLSGQFQSAVMWGFSTFKPGGRVNMGIQKKFKNNAVLSLVVNDVFKTSSWILETNRENYRSRWDYDSGTRAVNLSYRHQFGNRKMKGVNIKTGAEDERKRIQ